MVLRHLDLFSGIGGFALAARWAGFETVQFVEKDKFCQKVLAKHWEDVPIHDDIKTFSFMDEVDVLTGGFPCQPFSVAGKKRGIKDDRYLWPEMFRVIQQCHPNWIIAENVSGIVGMALDNILLDLEKEGYESQLFIIPACAANAPHRRDRLWIVANAMQKRCDNRVYYWQSRSVSKDEKWDMETLHKEWTQFIPESWQTMQGGEWMFLNSLGKRINDGIPTRLDKNRIKVLGNAIVPQIAFPFFKIIQLLITKEKEDVRTT